jgi:hypothetical protein
MLPNTGGTRLSGLDGPRPDALTFGVKFALGVRLFGRTTGLRPSFAVSWQSW